MITPMKHTSLILLPFLFILSACGPSEQEVRETKQEAKQELLNEQENQRTEDAIEQARQAKKEEWETYLIKVKAQLEAEESTMEKIKEYRIGRAQWEKEEQIRKQSIRIQTLEKNIEEAEKQIESYQ